MENLKASIPLDNSIAIDKVQMGGRRSKKCGGSDDLTVNNELLDMKKGEEEANEEDYDLLDKIDKKWGDEPSKIAEEGRGGPEYLSSLRMEEGEAGLPTMDIKGGSKRKRKSRRTRSRKNKKSSRKTGRKKSKSKRRRNA
jgi:hypothetical protein